MISSRMIPICALSLMVVSCVRGGFEAEVVHPARDAASVDRAGEDATTNDGGPDSGQDGASSADAAAVDAVAEDAALFMGFAVTASALDEADDMTAICQAQHGPGCRIADWVDLELQQGSSGDITPLLDALGMPSPNAQLWVTWDEQRIYTTSVSCPDGRFYFIERHDHVMPDYFFAHADIDSSLLSLGSWCDYLFKALCYCP